MKTRSCFVLTLFFVFSAILSAEAIETPAVTYKDGLISVRQWPVTAGKLLEMVCSAAELEVVVIGEWPKDKIVHGFPENKRPEEIIRSLLVGRSYAIIYNGQTRIGTNLQAPVSRTLFTHFSSDSPAIYSDEVPETSFSEDQAREKWLVNSIEELNQKISSGASDKEYETWLSVRNSSDFVVHDEDRLKEYETQLRQLRGY